jgi:hypothetical protein
MNKKEEAFFEVYWLSFDADVMQCLQTILLSITVAL